MLYRPREPFRFLYALLDLILGILAMALAAWMLTELLTNPVYADFLREALSHSECEAAGVENLCI